jgi:hypothetical protein
MAKREQSKNRLHPRKQPRDQQSPQRRPRAFLYVVPLFLALAAAVGWYFLFCAPWSVEQPAGGDQPSGRQDAIAVVETSRPDSPPIEPLPSSGSSTAMVSVVTPQARARWDAHRQGLKPLDEEWNTETLNTAAGSQLKSLGKLLTHPELLSTEQLQLLLAKNFSCGPLLPQNTRQTFEDQSLTVIQGVIDAETLQPGTSGKYRGAEGFTEALQSLLEPLREATDVRFKFKLFNIQTEDESFTTRQFFAISGQTPDGMLEQNATWLIRWKFPQLAGEPQLQWIGVEAFEQVRTHTTGPPLFVDCTMAALGDNDAYRDQLQYSISHWVERIEMYLDFYFFEHTGLAVGDVNGDDLEDIYVCQQGGLPNRLLVQQADGTFKDVSAEAGVDFLDLTYSALFVDLDNDGDQDMVVSTRFYVLFLSNDGQGNFTHRTAGSPGRGYSLAAADFDLDGDLDIYACLYYARRRDAAALPVPAPYYDANNGGANYLLRNDGDMTFTDITRESGLDMNNTRFSLAAAWEDYDNDGDADLYVANDFGRNNLYRNEGGKFTDVAAEAGVEDGAFGMSVSWGDYNHDGLMDIYVANMFSAAGNRVTYQRRFKPQATGEAKSRLQHTARGNTLFENRGDGTFRDVSGDAGVTMGRWGWASLFADINNDRWEDLVLSNGYFTGSDPNDL